MSHSIELRTERGSGERALFVGNTDSGKTTLIQALLAPMGSAVVMESKGDVRMWEAFARRFGYVLSGDPADIRRYPRVVMLIDQRSLYDRTGWKVPGTPGWIWTEALQSCWWRAQEGETLVVFEEAFDTLPSHTAHPEARRMSSAGRTQGLPVWIGAQLPIYVDLLTISQAEHCFSFAQPLPEYRDLLRMRRGVETDVLAELDFDAHEFAHHRMGSRVWDEFGPIRPVTKGPKNRPAEYAEVAAPDALGSVDTPGEVTEAPPVELTT